MREVNSMVSRNVETVTQGYEDLGKRNLDAILPTYADSFVVVDHATGLSMKSLSEVKQWMLGFVNASTDARITLENVIDCGDTVIAQLLFSGTNDGPFGPLPATGKHFSMEGCEIFRFDAEGKIVEEDTYYDQLGPMMQLGHLPALEQ